MSSEAVTNNPFIGTWNLESSENLEEVMKELGMNILFRKAAKFVKPNTIIEVKGDIWTVKSLSTFKNMINSFKLEEEFPDGNKL
jgi:fatty acid-binding protein 3, muscle and heart